MVLNKNKLISFKDELNQVNFIKHNLPGLYFLFDEDYKLVYIGESLLPLIRINDHYHRHYKNEKDKKGIGPVFTYARIMRVRDKDFRVRQHYEKKWIKKYNPPINFNGNSHAPYELTLKQLKGFMSVYDFFFKKQMPWYKYLNDEVLKKQDWYLKYRSERKKQLERKRRGYA